MFAIIFLKRRSVLWQKESLNGLVGRKGTVLSNGEKKGTYLSIIHQLPCPGLRPLTRASRCNLMLKTSDRGPVAKNVVKV